MTGPEPEVGSQGMPAAMPSQPLRFCQAPGCSAKVPAGYCALHQSAKDAARAHLVNRRLYRTERWKRLSEQRRADQPFCVGYPRGYHGTGLILADCTDHVLSARQFPERFFDDANLQSLCSDCNKRKAIAEEGGFGRTGGDQKCS